ncbi:coiled stalk of trimeric autotransporter adhesin family protein [Paraburkholderia xenovorans LB400]|nr:coiled stalk of trimeric autotransporter adhesin family protein [Paraburkholderia xenovorans LB400]
MPIAMAIGVAMLPGTAAAQAVTGNGGLELCPAGVGGIGSSWGPLSSAVGIMSCAPMGGGDTSGDGMSFSLNNAASTDGAWGFNSGQITARVTGYQDGHLELAAEKGIYMVNDVNMSGNKISSLAPGDVSSKSTDAVNGSQVYQYTRYFKANSPSSDPSTDARAIGTSSVASGPSSLAIGKNSSAYGANTSAIGTNSVALGAGSVASRNDAVSVGYLSADGTSQYTRQIVNVTAGAAGTDAVNVNQLNAAIASVSGGGSGDLAPNAVTYDTSASTLITLKGASGTKITNLTAGDISSIWSTDAVNGSQLYQTNQNVTNVANNVANVSGNLANVTNIVNNIVNNGIAGSPLVVTYDTSARDTVTLGGTDHTAAVKLTNVAPGDISSASSTDAVNGAQLYATNQNVSALASNVGDIVVNLYNRGAKYFHTNSSLADSSAIGTNAVAIGGAAIASADNSVALGANSVANRANAVSVGAAGTERQIINVANGTGATDAVNLQQLQAVAASISSGAVTGSFVAYDDSTKGSVTLKGASGSTITNLKAGALTASSVDAVNGSQLYQTNANVANVAGNLANVAGNVTYVTNTVNNIENGGGIKYFHANSSLADSSAAGADAVAIGGAANASAVNSVALGANSVANRANAVSVGALNAERQIINVAAGTQNTDAVNVAQMNTAIANASMSGGGSPDAVVYDSSSHNILTLGGVAASAPVALTNVAAGQIVSGSSDAVNGGQLYNVANSVAAALGAGSTVNKDGTVSAPGYTISGSTYGNVGDALNALNTAAGDLVSAAKYVKVVSSAAAASASGSESVAIGGNAMATGSNSLAIGAGATAKYNNSTAIGVNAITDAANTVSVGARGAEMRITHVANGINDTDAATVAQLSALQSKLLQTTQQSSGVKSLLLGAAVPVTSYIAVSSNVTGGGSTSASSDLNAMAIGPVAAATGIGALAVGSGSAAGSNASTAVGTGAGVASVNSTAIGYSATIGANSANSLAIGYNSRAQATNSMALGSFASATSAGSVVIGYNAFVNQAATNGMALGLNASVSAANGVAIGYNSIADRANAVSVGSSSQQNQIIYVAAGTNGTDAVNVNQLSGVTSIIGGGAAVNPDGTIKKPSFAIGGQTYTDVGSAINAAVSGGTANGVQYDTSARTKVTLGGTGATTAVTLSNVANGVANNDAVNVTQLQAMGATIGTSGVVTNSFVAYDDTTQGKISLKGTGGTTITNVKAGALSSASLDAVNGSQLYQTNANVANVAGNVANVTNVVNNITNGGGIKYFHANSTLADSSATGTNSVAIGGAASATAANSVALGANSVAGRANAVSVGAVGSERQIINVANATNGTDAVNLQQLQAMGANVNSSGVVTNSFVAYDDTSKGKVTLGGSGFTKAVTLTNVANGVANADAVNMAQLKAMGGTIDSSGNVTNAFVAYDDTSKGKVTLGGAGSTKAVALTNVANGVANADAVNMAQLKAMGGTIDSSGNVTNAFVAYDDTSKGKVTLGGAGSTKAVALTNVANGVANADAVNMAQLKAMGGTIDSSGNVTNAFVAYDDTSKGKVTLGGAGSTKAVALTNVANGVANADAVNMAQLKAMGGTIDSSGNVTNAFVAYDDTTLGKISLKGTGGTTITNVKAGALSSTSLDAVNGSQLYQTNANVANVAGNVANVAGNVANVTNVVNNITNGGGIKYFHANSTLADSSATGANSVAIGGAASATAANSVALGANSVAGRANAVSVGAAGSERQIINVANATNSTDAVNLQQLQAMGANVNSSGVVTNAFVSYDDTSKGKVTLGGSGSTKAVSLTNVAAGVASADAVNMGQLKQMGATVDTSGNVTNSFVAYDDTTLGKISLKGTGGTTITNVKAGALTSASLDAVNGGQLYQTNANVANVAGNLTNLTNVVNNITSGGGIKYFNAKSTLADSSATGTNSVAIGGAANASATNSVALGANSVAGRANAVSVGAAGSERQIINVANATNSTDAVNLSQLQAMGANVNSSGVVTNSFVAYDDTSKGKVTFGGAGSTAPVLLTNLAAGAVTSTSSDAINGSQLYQTAASMAGALGGGAALAKDGTISAPAYEITGSTYNNVGDALAAVDTQLGDINTNFSTNLKYVKIISQSNAAQASGSEAIAIGGNAMATGSSSLAIGAGATSKYDNSTAIGVNASTDAPNTVSVGARGAEMRITHVANGINDTDAATVAQLSALQSKLLQTTQQSGVKSLLLGAVPVTNYIAVSQNVTGGGSTSASNDLNAMAIGPLAAASGVGALAVGAGSIAGSDASTAVGTGAAVGSVNSTAIGYSASVGVNSANSLAIGYNSRAQALNSLAIGTEASATSAGSIAIGYGAFLNPSATNSMALGLNSSVSAANAVAIGYNAVADRANAVSVGSSKQQSQIINVAAGTANTDAVNLGQMNAAINAVAGGGSPNAVVYDTSAHMSVTLGSAGTPVKVSNVANGVANNDAVNVAQLTAMGGTINSSGVVTNSFVAYDDTTKGSITLKGASGTTITNVKAGSLTANSTDAINGGQLYQTNANVANLAANVANITGNVTNTVNNIVNGGGIKYFHANSTLADSSATGTDSVAIGGAANATAANSVALGANSVAGRANAVSVGAVGAERQIINVANATNSTDAVNLSQLQAMGANVNSSGVVTNAFVAYDDSTKGKVTLGGVGSSMPVTLANVAEGQVTSTSKQAINGSQLYGTANSVASALGGTSSVGSNGNVTAAFSLDGKTYNSVATTMDALNAKIATGSTDGVVYDTSAHNKLTLGGVNATTPVTVANVAAATSDDQAVNLAQLKAAGLNVDTSGNVTNSFVAYDNTTRGTVTFNAGGAPTQLKNVAAGTDLTDAVNFGQMQSYVAQNGGGGTTNGVSYDDSLRGKVTLGGVGSTTPVTLTNVAAGSAATDAVNYSQFSSLESQVNNLANGGAGSTTYVNINTPASGGTAAVASGSDSIAIGNGASASGSESIAIGKNTVTTGDNSVAMGAGASAPNANAVALGTNSTTDRDNSVSVGSAGAERQITNVAAGTQGTDAVNLNQLNSAMGNMSNSINNVDRNAAKGIASASALNIVTPYLPGRTTLNAGVANYRGYQSVGLGVSRWNEKGTINYNLGVSTSGGNSTIVRAGIGIVLGN